MTLTVEPPPVEAPDAGVIEDARRRQRRQRCIAAAVLLAGVGLVAAALAGGGGNTSRAQHHGGGRGAAAGVPLASPSGVAASDVAVLRFISDMGLIGPGAGWAANGIGFYLTFDDGARWRRVPRFNGDVVANLGPVASVGRSDIFVADDGGKGRGTCVNPGPSVAAYAVGVVSASTDAGQRWRASTLPGCALIFGLSFASPEIGFAVASSSGGGPDRGTLDVTDDGARRWQRVGPTPFVGPIEFASREDGWGVAAPGVTTRPLDRMGALYRTTDGGRNWQRVPICSGASRDATATICGTPRFFGSRDGVVPVGRVDRATGTCSFLIDSTTDGGARWSSHALPADPHLCAYFSTNNPYSATNGTQRLTVPFSASSATDWVVFIGPTLYATTDGGRRWSRLTPKPTLSAPELAGNGVAINDSGPLDFASPADGWLIARWSGASPVFDYTTDGGKSWKPLTKQ